MDKLKTAAEYYKNNLCGRSFSLEAVGKRLHISLIIKFDETHFKHLVGLHKLKNMPQICKRSSAALYKSILRGDLLETNILNSENYLDVEKRLDCFSKMKDVLSNSDLMLKNTGQDFGRIGADFLLTKNDNGDDKIGLFLKDIGNINIPVSYIYGVPDYYINNAKHLIVKSFKEITESSDKENNKEPDVKPPEHKEIDAVESVIKQCSHKLNDEIEKNSSGKKEQVQQVKQAEQVGQVKQVQKIKSKEKNK